MDSRIPWTAILVLVVSASLAIFVVMSFIGDSSPASDFPGVFETSTSEGSSSSGASLTAIREEMTAIQKVVLPSIQARDEFIRVTLDEIRSRLERIEVSQVNVVRKNLTIDDVKDGEEKLLFVIETAEADVGYYSVYMHLLVGQGLNRSSRASASRAYFGTFTRQMVASGEGSNSRITDLGTSENAANIPQLRDIGSIFARVIENSEYQTELRITVALLGTNPIAGVAIVSVELLHAGFATPPRILEITPDS